MSPASPASRPEISVVIPVYNERETLPELRRRLHDSLESTGLSWEVIFVNDGSADDSLALMCGYHRDDGRFKVIDFSRNFGHQIAVTAGMDHATGQAVIVMDGDLQDPPEILPDLIARWRQGYEVVYAVRRKRKESLAMRFLYSSYYRLMNRISDTDLPLDSGDFALIDRRVADMLVALPERNRYVRGLRAWLGFRQTGFEYERDARFAGEPKYNLRRLFNLAFDGIVSFSEAPLRLVLNLGIVITAGAGLMGLWTLAKRLLHYEVVPGFATLALLVLFFGGVQLLTVGLLGEYVSRIYTEVKGRPRYVLRSLHGVDPTRERYGLPPAESE